MKNAMFAAVVAAIVAAASGTAATILVTSKNIKNPKGCVALSALRLVFA
jgi:hypothetical protein